MAQLIDKAALVTEIERLENDEFLCDSYDVATGFQNALQMVQEFINTLEVKETDAWHSQEKEDIYDAVKDWSSQTFVCIMKDGSIQKFIGNLDEDYEGHINAHIYGTNDDYDNVDDIVKWIEFT